MLEDAEVLGLVLLKVDKEYVPKPGEWLVIYETSGNSFHFIRWDFQLGWTEKPGIHPAKDCIDPRTNTTSIYVSYAVHRKYSSGGRPATRMTY